MDYGDNGTSRKRSKIMAVQRSGNLNASFMVTIPKRFAHMMHIDNYDSQVIIKLHQKTSNGTRYYCTIEKIDSD